MSDIALSLARGSAVVGVAVGAPTQPAPQPVGLPPASLPEGDALASLYAILAKDRNLGMKRAASDLKYGQKLRKDAIARQQAAVRKAASARKKGRFWKKLAKTCSRAARAASVVAAVSMAVGTGGAATPVAVLAIAGASMSAAAFVQGETRILQSLGVSDSWAGKAELGLSVGSLVCSAGALGAQLAADEAVEHASETVDVLERVARGASGASELAGGAAAIQSGRHDAEAEDALADATEARLDNKLIGRQIDAVIEAVEYAEASDERLMSGVRHAMEIRDMTWVSASRRA